MNVIATELPGVMIFEPRVFRDERGLFLETYQEQRYRAHGIDAHFVQDNFSRSHRHVLRGLHYQRQYPQGKFVQVLRGEVYDVAVDIRSGSPTFGRWAAAILSGDNARQMYIPPGFAHGFCVISEQADFIYKCTDFYHPEDERGIIWNDPGIGIEWPIREPFLSPKDAVFPKLNELSEAELPKYQPQP